MIGPGDPDPTTPFLETMDEVILRILTLGGRTADDQPTATFTTELMGPVSLLTGIMEGGSCIFKYDSAPEKAIEFGCELDLSAEDTGGEPTFDGDLTMKLTAQDGTVFESAAQEVVITKVDSEMVIVDDRPALIEPVDPGTPTGTPTSTPTSSVAGF